jgi:uncharacterized membrane protein YkvA (DUF1232 family)
MTESLITKLKAKVKQMKKDVLALYYAYRNADTPWTAKVLIGITIGYLLSPIDLIPDFIPVLGLLDDLVIVPILIVISIRLIPAAVWSESKLQAEQFPISLDRKNWRFAAVIVGIWLAVLYFLYSFLAGWSGR